MLRRSTKKKEGVTARSKALEVISRRSHTEAEVVRKLLDSGFTAAETEDAAGYLRELKYLDDDAIATEMARTLASRRNLGPGRIAAKLRSRGIKTEIVEKAVAALLESVPQKESAKRALMKKYHGKTLFSSDPEERRRASQFLFRMGFDWDIITSVIGTFKSDG